MGTFTLAITGSGGAGVISTGELLLRIAGQRGYYGMLKKSFSPQIRGGESAAIIRLGDSHVESFDGTVQLLVALDWNNFARFADEIPITPATVIIQDSKAGELPDLLQSRSDILTIDGSATAANVASDWVNMVFLGILSRALNCPQGPLLTMVRHRFKKHDGPTQSATERAVLAGYTLDLPPQLLRQLASPQDSDSLTGTQRWIATGNQMAGLGALEAGIRFVAAYPITPASDVLEWLASHLPEYNGHLVQAEDELAAINMVIGAGFGGVPAMTATSGPGMALMAEAMGLAVASEIPTVVLNVMRGGPSTGIPTKSEQADFNLAVYGLHGDAPHVVLACQSISDCYNTMAWATVLASQLQTLVIVLSDQFLGQSLQILAAPQQTTQQAFLTKPETNTNAPYWRYLDTANGISPMAVPGDIDHMYTADGLEHTQAAVPSPRAEEHQRQLDKRLRKLDSYEFGDQWADYWPATASDTLILCWGSITGSAIEAQALLDKEDYPVAILSLRLLSPLPLEKLRTLLNQYPRRLVVEQNHGGQFFHYLQSQLPTYRFHNLARPGPLLITPGEIKQAIEGDDAP